MILSHRFENNICVVDVAGDLVLDQVNATKTYINEILKDGPNMKLIVLNLEGVSFIDSSGIGFLIATWRLVQKREGVFAVCRLNQKLSRLLEMTSLKGLIKVYGTLSDALTDENFAVPTSMPGT